MKELFAYDPGAKTGKTAILIMLILAVIFFAARFIQPQYQPEFEYDEITDMYEGVLKQYGGENFFYYNPLKGAAGNLLNQICFFTSPIVKENIEYYKYAGAALLPFLAAGIFLLTLNLFGMAAAIAAVFVLCQSFWNYHTSGFFLANNLTPVLAAFAFYFISKKSIKIPDIAAFIVVTVLCVNTYILWMLAVPLFLYIFYERFRGTDDPSEKNLAKNSSIALIITVAAAMLFFLFSADSSVFVRFFQVSVVKNKWGAEGILQNLKDLGFIFRLPFLNPVEWIFFIWGFALVCLNLKERPFRVLLFMFIIFSLPLVISGFHQGRSVLMQIPAFIIIALGIRQLLTLKSKKYFIIVPVLMCIFPAYYMGKQLVAVNSLAPQDTMDRSIAKYLNSTYGDKVSYLPEFEYVYMDDPRKVTIRLKSTYKRNGLTDYTALRFNMFWKNDLEKYFKRNNVNTSTHLFESSVTGRYKKFPSVLVVIPAGSAVEKKLRGYDAALREIKLKMPWQSGQDIIDSLNSHFSSSEDDVIMNTVLKDLKSDTYLNMGMPEMAVNVLLDRTYPSFMPGDFIMRIERIKRAIKQRAQEGKNG